MLIRIHPLPEIDLLERRLQDLKDSLAAERREGVRRTTREPGGHRVIRHFVEMRLIDPEVLNLSSLLNVSSTGTPFFSNPLIF